MSAFGATRHERLGELTRAVSYAVGAHPQCITGVALLVELAKEYGIELTPTAVSLAGQSHLGFLSTGSAATEHLRVNGVVTHGTMSLREGESGWSDDSPFLQSGHMVAIDSVSDYLLDPTFEQFVAGGFPNVVIATRIDPGVLEWPVELSEHCFVTYITNAEFDGWQDGYERARIAVVPMARSIAAHLKQGGSPNTHGVRLDLDGAILI